MVEEAKCLTAKVHQLEDMVKAKDDEIKVLKKETRRLNCYVEQLLCMVRYDGSPSLGKKKCSCAL